MARRKTKSRRSRKLAITFGLLLLVLVILQFIPARRTNPPIEAPARVPDQVGLILQRACYDCHSHDTRWPWYSHVAPLSWMVAEDVRKGRRDLNFSVWENYDPLTRSDLKQEILLEVKEGRMPPPVYLWFHPEASLDREDVAILEQWTK